MTGPRDADAPGAWATLAHELRRRSLRGVKRLVRPLWMRRLMRRNLDSRETLLSAHGPVVSLTTYEKRWHSVHFTIESIGCGRLRPSRLVLWIAPSVLQAGTPETLQRLVARGLEIRTWVDGEPRRHGNTRDMIHKVPELIAYISDVWTLLPGDIIMTGTPSGLGGFLHGQSVDIEISGIGTLSNPALNRDESTA